jgi:serine/threonine-protein kinase
MSAPDFERWGELYDRAMALPEAERVRFLELACAGEPELLDRMRRLIADQDAASRWFDALGDSLLGDATEALETTRLESVVGPYRLVRLLGVGGMGTVYLAERSDGQFTHQVALKLLRTGLVAEAGRRRFLAERQLLARIEHPHVARLLDGGVASDATPWFAMELVRGTPIVEWCESRGLPIEARLRLFLQLGDAVQYLHRHLVVHRDLKPANVLVTEDGVVKLLDFGIAKLLEAGGDYPSETGGHPFTPRYAAPEQLRGEPVSTTTDVYALGLILFELLTGCRPFEQATTLAEFQRLLLEAEPPRPSAVAPPARRRQLAGDLDTICLRALRHAPGERYPSAERLVDDIRRHVAGLPITARAGGLGYRARKFARRHPVGVTMAAGVLLLGSLGLAAFVSQARRAERERDRAERVSQLLAELFTVADPGQARGETVTAREVMDRGVDRIRRELAAEPELRADLFVTMGQAYRQLGLYPRAVALLLEAVAIRREVLAPTDLRIVRALNGLGEAYRLGGRFDSARLALVEARTLAEATGEPRSGERAEALDRIGLVLLATGKADSAESHFRDALAINQALGPGREPFIAENLQNLGAALAARGDEPGAAPLFQGALDLRRAALGPEHPAVAATLNNLATLLGRLGRMPDAIRAQREALALYTRLVGPEHPQVATMHNNLGMLLHAAGDVVVADSHLRRSLALRRAGLSAGHPDVAQSLSNLGLVLQDRGLLAEAVAAHNEALAIRRAALGPSHPLVAQSLNNLALARQAGGELGTAERLFLEALELLRARLGADHPLIATNLNNLGAVRLAAGDAPRAVTYYQEALAMRRKLLPEGHPHLAYTLVGLGRALLVQGKSGEAEPLLREAVAIRSKSLPVSHPLRQEAERALADARP